MDRPAEAKSLRRGSSFDHVVRRQGLDRAVSRRRWPVVVQSVQITLKAALYEALLQAGIF